MKLYFFGLFLILNTVLVRAQEAEQEAINKDVWFNFMQAYQDLDASLFNQIHTEDVIRISGNSGNTYVGQAYKDRNLESFNRWNQEKVRQTIEFSFLSREVTGNKAHEIGIFKLTRKEKGQDQYFYGKFEVTLQKVNNIWRIKSDADSNENGTIGEEHFQKGAKLIY